CDPDGRDPRDNDHPWICRRRDDHRPPLSRPMALSDLLAGLKAEAAAEDARLDVETLAEATRIAAAAQDEARILQEQALRVVEDELRQEAEMRRARARLAAAVAVRHAREEAFHEFLAEVHRRVDAIRESPKYPMVLRAL